MYEKGPFECLHEIAFKFLWANAGLSAGEWKPSTANCLAIPRHLTVLYLFFY